MLSEKRKEQLRESIQQALFIYVNAKQAFQYCRYIHNPDSEQERDYLKTSRHFGYIGHMLWRNSVVEICKLLSKSKGDKYSVVRLLDKFWNAGEFLHANIPISKLQEWEKFLIDHEQLINKIKSLRDQIYGHTDDPDVRKLLTGPTFAEYQLLLDFIEGILRTVYFIVFQAGLDASTPTEIPKKP